MGRSFSKVAMFYSMRPDGQFDDFSLHGACPVITGEAPRGVGSVFGVCFSVGVSQVAFLCLFFVTFLRLGVLGDIDYCLSYFFVSVRVSFLLRMCVCFL